MLYTIQNEHMKAVIDSYGAQLTSLSLDGHEYLWEGNPDFWKEHAPVLFPFVGRFTDGKYMVEGREYEMLMHGFAKRSEFTLIDKSDSSVCFGLTENEETLKQYPFRFSFQITYTLDGNTLSILDEVQNHSENVMYFGLGGHPGFKVPLEEGEKFEDYYLEFARPSKPDQVLMTEAVYLTGNTKPYPLENDRIIRLHHDLFDHDAIVLQNMPDSVTLKSDKSSRSVTVMYPGMPWVGFWHAVKKEAPYVCIEPWVTLPSRDGIIEDFANRSDLIRLETDAVYQNLWGIELQ